MSQFVYHFKPKEMKGSALIPLNKLQNIHPEVYAEQVKKYKGREILLQKRTPILDCLWNDVLHLSPVNPQIILDTWRQEELNISSNVSRIIEVYKIPIERLEESTTICYQCFNYDFENYDSSLDKSWHFKKENFSEQKVVDLKQIEVWKKNNKEGRPLFWYSHTMHVLAQQSIDINNCELILCQ